MALRPQQVSERGRGIPEIAAMVNITRVHNSAAAVSFMRRVTALAQARQPHREGGGGRQRGLPANWLLPVLQ